MLFLGMYSWIQHCSPIVSLITGFLLEAEVSEEAGNVCFTELIEAW